MRRLKDEVRMRKISWRRVNFGANWALVHSRSESEETTYADETADPGPHAIVWQLPPSSRVHDGPLVDATTDEIDEDSYQSSVMRLLSAMASLMG